MRLHDVARATKKCAKLGISQKDLPLLVLTNRIHAELLSEYFDALRVFKIKMII